LSVPERTGVGGDCGVFMGEAPASSQGVHQWLPGREHSDRDVIVTLY